MIGDYFNYDDSFFRDLTICVLDTLEGQVKWVNRFTSGDVEVNVPFYYSMVGGETMLLDSFADDIVSDENRFIELNTDIIPRGHITLKNIQVQSDSFANPNVFLRTVVENETEIKKILTKVRALPISVNYDLEIILDSEIDTFKASQALFNTLWIYKYMYFEYNYMNIDAIMLVPDENQIEINREIDLTSDNKVKMTVSFEVQTYYPAFRRDKLNTSPTDQNNYTINSSTYNLFGDKKDFISNGEFIEPKRTRWFNNILKARNRNRKDVGNNDKKN